MNSDTIALVERVKSRLAARDAMFSMGAPASDDDIVAAEVALGCVFPPSYREFLRHFGGLSMPIHLGVVHHFVGLGAQRPVEPPPLEIHGVVEQTLAARAQKHLGVHLVVVGMGAGYQEWFCLDTEHPGESGEFPIRMFDAADNTLDGEFYPDFESMVREVMGFVVETLDTPSN